MFPTLVIIAFLPKVLEKKEGRVVKGLIRRFIFLESSIRMAMSFTIQRFADA